MTAKDQFGKQLKAGEAFTPRVDDGSFYVTLALQRLFRIAQKPRLAQGTAFPVTVAICLLTAIPLPSLAQWGSYGTLPCTDANVRYASSSNRLYIENDALCTLEEVSAIRPSQIVRTTGDEPDTGDTFFLNVNLFVEDGSALRIWGPRAGGAVGAFLLKSNNDPPAGNYVFVRAHWGHIDIRSTRVMSWDEAAGTVDMEYADFGRAYLQARSFQGGGSRYESIMDIHDSDIGYLGHLDSEAYGLSWKALGPLEDLESLNVYGQVSGNIIHHNYFGAYTYGARDMLFTENKIHSNVVYGLDPHDDSDFVQITNNAVYGNGRHGIICSKRCNGIAVSGNRVYSNGGHGIMLHRQVDDSLVEDNEVYDNVMSGIILFDSDRNVVRNNRLRRNGDGIKLSVGASDNVVENNTVEDSLRYSLYVVRGSDLPSRNDGRPTNNVFRNNLIRGSVTAAVRASGGGSNKYLANRIRGGTKMVRISNTEHTEFLGDKGRESFVISGTETMPSHVEYRGSREPGVELRDAYSSFEYVGR